MPPDESTSIENAPAIDRFSSSRQTKPQSGNLLPGTNRDKLILFVLLLAVVASFFVYAPREKDFQFYAAEGNAFFDGRDIYLDTPWQSNTMPPFFSLVAVPLGLVNRVSPYLNHVLWIALNWASIVLVLDLIARLIYGKRLRWRPDESSLTITSSELLIPFLLTLPFILNNFELLQINMILYALALWGVYLQATGKDAAGGIAIAAAAAMKVMAIALLPYLLYRKRWRAAAWMAGATAFFSLSPAFFMGWGKFWKDVGLWSVSLNATMGSGNSLQSVYSMWDRIIGYGYIPFAVPGTFLLPFSGSHSARLAWELTGVVIALLGLLACRGTPKPDSRWAQIEWSLVFVAATILSPLTRKPYLVVLFLPYALLYAGWRSSDLDARARRILRNVMFVCFATSIPTLHDLIGKALAVRLEMGSIVTYGVLIMLGGLMWYRTLAPRNELG